MQSNLANGFLPKPLSIRKSFEESGHAPFVDVSETFNEAIVELVRPVISAKEADVPAIVVSRILQQWGRMLAD